MMDKQLGRRRDVDDDVGAFFEELVERLNLRLKTRLDAPGAAPLQRCALSESAQFENMKYHWAGKQARSSQR